MIALYAATSQHVDSPEWRHSIDIGIKHTVMFSFPWYSQLSSTTWFRAIGQVTGAAGNIDWSTVDQVMVQKHMVKYGAIMQPKLVRQEKKKEHCWALDDEEAELLMRNDPNWARLLMIKRPSTVVNTNPDLAWITVHAEHVEVVVISVVEPVLTTDHLILNSASTATDMKVLLAGKPNDIKVRWRDNSVFDLRRADRLTIALYGRSSGLLLQGEHLIGYVLIIHHVAEACAGKGLDKSLRINGHILATNTNLWQLLIIVIMTILSSYSDTRYIVLLLLWCQLYVTVIRSGDAVAVTAIPPDDYG
jgi:hypothetical protein